MTHTLQKLPGALGLYARALATATRKPAKNVRVPHLEVRIAAMQASRTRLDDYRAICGFEPGEHLPITFPQVQAAPLHMWLMLQPQFPMPLMGIVHLRNRFQVLGPMPADRGYDVRAALVESRRTHQGCEFDLLTEYSDTEGQVVYRSLMTPLYRQKSEGPVPSRPRAAAPESGLAEYRSFDVPADIGRRYAPVSGDYNPIHLSAISARAFGFPRAIAHGMWAVARAASLLESATGRPATDLSVQFRQPLLLPGKVALKFRPGNVGSEFALLSRSSDKVHFTGQMR